MHAESCRLAFGIMSLLTLKARKAAVSNCDFNQEKAPLMCYFLRWQITDQWLIYPNVQGYRENLSLLVVTMGLRFWISTVT
jgi:hypothetical protein